MGYFSLFVCVVVGVIIGLFVGGILDKDNDKQESHRYIPSIDEVLCVLNVIRATYRCTPHEDDCMAEAIRLIESMEGKIDDEGENN